MKKLIAGIAVLLVLAMQIGQAQEADDFRFTIKTNPLAALGGPLFIAFIPITGEYKVIFEARTAQKQSIEVGASYLGPSILIDLNNITSGDSLSGINASGFRVQAAYKFFISRTGSAPDGFYVGPHFSYAAARIKSKDDPNDFFDASKLNVSAILGYQLITAGGFTMNIYTGLGLKHRDYSIAEMSGDLFDFDQGGQYVPNVPFGFTFGYAF